jgi:hypothetical protein
VSLVALAHNRPWCIAWLRPSGSYRTFLRHGATAYSLSYATPLESNGWCLVNLVNVLALSAGRDPILLGTRNELLKSIGCIVVSASSSADLVNEFFGRDFDVIVLCHTIPPEERRKVLLMIRHYRESTPTMIVSGEYDSDYKGSMPRCGKVVPPEPHELVSAIRGSFPGISLQT